MTNPVRHPLWERRLIDYLTDVARRPHAYGQHDCMLHPGSGAEAMTGLDFTSAHRGKYRSPASAVRHLNRLGFQSPEQMLDSLFEEVPIGFAQRGDIVLTPANDGASWGIPGVVAGDAALVIAEGAATGLFPVKRRDWLKAWKVGR